MALVWEPEGYAPGCPGGRSTGADGQRRDTARRGLVWRSGFGKDHWSRRAPSEWAVQAENVSAPRT